MERFIRNTIEFIYFIYSLIKYGWFFSEIDKNYSGEVVMLANGPSLKDVLIDLTENNEFKNKDFIVLNFFAFEEVFFKIKPKHYCLADPMFFQESHRKENVLKLFNILETKVDWNLNIYIQKHNFKDFISFSGLKNNNLNVKRVNAIPYYGFESFRNYFYSKGLSIPPLHTVANLSIYVGINLGYDVLNLYGVDHTFFDSLCVNDKNEVCNREKHFYSDAEVVLKPIRRNDNDEIWKMSDFIKSIHLMFKSHDLLENYARSRKVKIINHTECSLIDSYVRTKNS